MALLSKEPAHAPALTNNEMSAPISELPNYLKRWMVLQEELSTLNGELKQRRTQSKALKEIILRIMDSNKVATLNISKGAVVHKTYDSSEKISTHYMLKHCKDFFNGDEERAKALVKYLEDHRTVIKKHDLKLQSTRTDDDKLSHRS
jgi:hypothetical protein